MLVFTDSYGGEIFRHSGFLDVRPSLTGLSPYGRRRKHGRERPRPAPVIE